MAVPKIPSNQLPAMYNVRNVDDKKQREDGKHSLRWWMDTYIAPELLTEQDYYSLSYGTPKTGQDEDPAKTDLRGTLRMDLHFVHPSLTDLGLLCIDVGIH